MKLRWKAAFGIAALNDLVDLTPLGSAPVIGDVLDLLTNIALWPVLKTRRNLLTSVEYLPGADFLPVYTATVYYSYQKEEKTQ